MELIDLGNFYVRGPKATKEEAFLYENRESGLYCASVYDRKILLDKYIFYYSNTLDFIIHKSIIYNEIDVLVSPRLLKLRKMQSTLGRFGRLSVSQEVFLDGIRSENHPAADWLLFNQSIWNHD